MRDEQAKVLHATAAVHAEDVLQATVRGQYGDGMMDGEVSAATATKTRSAPDSTTETFVALKLYIDNWRWADVPFYLRTGKMLPKRQTEITIQFKRAPFQLFRDTPVETLTPNQLVIHIQPDEGVSLSFSAKVPGPQLRLGDVNMNFAYNDYFGSDAEHGLRAAALRLHDGRRHAVSTRRHGRGGLVVVEPILDVWRALPPRDFPNYAAGTWGPKAADEMLEQDGRAWRTIEP